MREHNFLYKDWTMKQPCNDCALRNTLSGSVFCKNCLDKPKRDDTIKRPKIVCLCGSTRFYDEWQQANFDETMKGNVVLTVGFYPHCADKSHADHVGVTPLQKKALDELHKRKIDLADEIFVLNVNGYIGKSTRSEIEYAKRFPHKKIIYLEPTKEG